jgi:Fur family peroxide stress response transcriptional regulator
MADPPARFEELIAKLREHEHRLTPQRVALLRVLSSSEGHPSASQLYDQLKVQFPTTSPATVYKTLHLLKEMGEVLELGFGDDDNRYDGKTAWLRSLPTTAGSMTYPAAFCGKRVGIKSCTRQGWT